MYAVEWLGTVLLWGFESGSAEEQQEYIAFSGLVADAVRIDHPSRCTRTCGKGTRATRSTRQRKRRRKERIPDLAELARLCARARWQVGHCLRQLRLDVHVHLGLLLIVREGPAAAAIIDVLCAARILAAVGILDQELGVLHGGAPVATKAELARRPRTLGAH